MDRRAFLTRLAPKSGRRVPPPYTHADTDFAACAACSAPCVDACADETGVLVREEGGAPYLDFARAGCTFCAACLEACPEGVLSEGRTPLARVWIETGSCLAHQGVVCVACRQACGEDAVVFEGMMRPRIDADACTGCGLCVPACPVEAVAWSA